MDNKSKRTAGFFYHPSFRDENIGGQNGRVITLPAEVGASGETCI